MDTEELKCRKIKENQRFIDNGNTLQIDNSMYIGYHTLCMGWGNCALLAIRILERFYSDSGEITRQAVIQLAVVCWGWRPLKRKRAFCKTPGVLPGGAFSFLGDLLFPGLSVGMRDE